MQAMRSFSFAIGLLLSVQLLPSASPSAQAMGRDLNTVVTTSLYGMAAGTVLGLAAFPFTQDVRGIFVGTSVGLYTGIVVGVYHIWNREDPYNPLKASYTVPGRSAYALSSAQRALSFEIPLHRF